MSKGPLEVDVKSKELYGWFKTAYDSEWRECEFITTDEALSEPFYVLRGLNVNGPETQPRKITHIWVNVIDLTHLMITGETTFSRSLEEIIIDGDDNVKKFDVNGSPYSALDLGLQNLKKIMVKNVTDINIYNTAIKEVHLPETSRTITMNDNPFLKNWNVGKHMRELTRLRCRQSNIQELELPENIEVFKGDNNMRVNNLKEIMNNENTDLYFYDR